MTGFTLEVSAFSDANSRHSAKVMDHYFNHNVTMILPGLTSSPQTVDDCLQEVFSYKLLQLPVYRLLEVPFISAFVKKGSIHMLSHGTKLDCEDCVALTPSGVLVLYLTKDTFQEMGLDASAQTHLQKKTDQYQVKIDLRASHFRPGRKCYDKTMKRLKEHLDFKMDFLVSWVPHDSEVCPSSVGVYFTDLCDAVNRVELSRTTSVMTSLAYPRVDHSDPGGGKQGCHFQEMFEWMGAMACGIDVQKVDSVADNYTSSLCCPEPQVNCPRCCVLQVTGFIPPHAVLKLLEAVRTHSSTSSSSLPASLTVHGFRDSPLMEKTQPNHVYMDGSNLYSFLMFPQDKYWLYSSNTS